MENVLPPVVGENVDEQLVQKGQQKLYSISRLNQFLDYTKGQRKISVASFFPDYNLFLKFLEIQKCCRIKKLRGKVRA